MAGPAPGRVFDADHHYYEALDAFTRHLDPRLASRTIEWAEIGGRRYHVVAGRVVRAVVNPTFDPVAAPGALAEYYRGNPRGLPATEYLKDRGPIPPEYRDRDARLAVMDAQGVRACWMFPTLGVLYEAPLAHDVEAVGMVFHAFNRWLDDDWGYAHEQRIFAAPYLTLADPRWTVAELEHVLDRGARVVCVRPAAPTTATGRRPPGDPFFDDAWRALEEAGVTVVVHAGDAGTTYHGYADDEYSAVHGRTSLFKMLVRERPIYDFLGSLIVDRLFERFPDLRLASVENGATFLPGLFTELQALHTRHRGYFDEDPVETFRRHVWINPFWEDDLDEVLALMGSDRVVFGSDWPHVEGLRHPRDYDDAVEHLDEATRRQVLHDNAAALTAPRPR